MASASKQPVPELRSGIDVTKVNLSVEEGFVVSRIDGRSGVDSIAKLIGRDMASTTEVLTRLAKLGVIRFGDVEPEPVPAISTTPTPSDGREGKFGSFVFAPDLMVEDSTLDEPRRRRVIWTDAYLNEWTHYELLEVSREAGPREIKKAYFARSKEWHPDQFGQGELGTFKRMIEGIYKQVNEAYRVLSSSDKRESYNQSLPQEEELPPLLSSLPPVRQSDGTLSEPPEVDAAAIRRELYRQKRHKSFLQGRRKKNNPVRKRLEQAREYYDKALVAEADGQLLEALRMAQMALTYDEKRTKYQELVGRLKDDAGGQRIQRHLKQARKFESMTRYDDAIRILEEAVRIAPNSPEARLRLAYNMLMDKRDTQLAMSHAQRASTHLAEDPETHYVLGRLYEEAGLDKLAKRSYERSLELKPTYGEAKKRLKRLKWGF